jgi:hypothetical protein
MMDLMRRDDEDDARESADHVDRRTSATPPVGSAVSQVDSDLERAGEP